MTDDQKRFLRAAEAKLLAGIRSATCVLFRPTMIMGSGDIPDRVVPRVLVKKPCPKKHMLGLGCTWVTKEGEGYSAHFLSLN